ncbi:hypothetical protein DL93DRAFT_2078571 [Clavulina sp. PMI_390]|nr:hypothetical protein DL93DRAFT_2078571 [Clavulina sp. PMI_390]
MPLNYTIDAQSPILSYVGSGWAPISSTRDASYASYNNKTAVTTNHFGDTMTFSFFGTAIW